MIGSKTTATLKRYSESLGPTGATVKVWSDVKILTGVLHTLGGNERFMALKKSVVNTHRFYMDFRKDVTITEKDILVSGLKQYEITGAGVDPVNQQRMVILDLWEVQ